MTKRELREKFSEIRGGIPTEVRTSKSREICRKFLSLSEYERAQTVMIYMSFRSEVETADIAQGVLQSGRRLVVPKCNIKTGEILPCEIKSLGELKAGEYGIAEPTKIRLCGKDEIDIVAVPALAFDRDNFRLGYGGGYYDRFLKDFTGLSAGLCFSECMTDKLPRGRFDVRTDTVLTD